MERYESVFKSGTYSNLLQLADGKLTTEDGFTFDIHRVILACKSEYFRNLFCFNNNRREFTIPGVSGRCLAEILRYIYTEENVVNAENMAEVLTAADYLVIENLRNQIKETFKNYLTIANCVQVFEAANLINDEEIAFKSLRLLSVKFEEVVQTSKHAILDLPFETLKNILSSTSLCVCKESTVWETIVEWTEKDTPTRLSYVPQLLTCLSRELDENLSSSILQHDIVSQNPFMGDLQKIKASFDSTCNLEILLHYQENFPNAFKDSKGFRIPSHLHVISYWNSEDAINTLYITYDENIDVWRKIGEIDFQVKLLYIIGRYLYLFEKKGRNAKFDLVSREWVPMQNIPNDFLVQHATHNDENLYVLGIFDPIFTYAVEGYDTVNDVWFAGIWLVDIFPYAISAILDKKIYAVEKTLNDSRSMVVFDPAIQLFSQLSPPGTDTAKDRYSGTLMAFRKKLYLIGRVMGETPICKLETYNPETDKWEDLPDLPGRYMTYTGIINDRLIVQQDPSSNNKKFSWNDTEGKWEEVVYWTCVSGSTDHYFTTVDDVDTVRMIKESTQHMKVVPSGISSCYCPNNSRKLVSE